MLGVTLEILTRAAVTVNYDNILSDMNSILYRQHMGELIQQGQTHVEYLVRLHFIQTRT